MKASENFIKTIKDYLDNHAKENELFRASYANCVEYNLDSNNVSQAYGTNNTIHDDHVTIIRAAQKLIPKYIKKIKHVQKN